MVYNHNLCIYLKDLYTYFSNKHDYELFCEAIYNYILDDYSRASENTEIITNKNKSINITLFQLLINLYLLEFNFMYKVEIDESWIWDVTTEFLNNYHKNIEKLANRIYEMIKKNKKIAAEAVLSQILSNITERLERLTELLSPIATPTMDIVSFSNFCMRNRKFNELLNTTLDQTKTTKDLEIECVEKGKELKQIILEDGKSCLFPFIESDCLNQTQLTQMFVAVGPRMTTNNIVLSHVMKRSYLNGLENVGDLIAEGEIANKALIYKKRYVGDSGYMSRESNLLTQGLHIDYKTKDCGTSHYINYNVKDKKHLELIYFKNIILPNGKLHMVTSKDTDLIGTTVRMRSIVCCCHKEAGKVCMNCYGNPLEIKQKMDIGGVVAIEILNVLSNAVMAVKHHTTTNTVVFSNPIMLKYFNLEEGKLIMKKIDENLENVSLAFEKDYIEDFKDRIEDEDYDYDDDELDSKDEDEEDIDSKSNNTITSKIINNLRLVVKKFNPETGDYENEETEITNDGSFLVLADEMMTGSRMKLFDTPIDSDDAFLNLSSVKPGMTVFDVKYITRETSKYLKDLKSIIDRSKVNWWYNDLDTPINNFADLIIDAGLKNEEMVFLEPIIRALCRNPEEITSRPDFSKENTPTVIINLRTGILEGDLYSALIFERLTDTFENIRSFRNHNHGINDNPFKTSDRHDFDYFEEALKKKGIC